MTKLKSAKDIQSDWDSNPRWKNVKEDTQQMMLYV